MVAEDEDEQEERIMDAIEYMDVFINPERVKHVRNTRNNPSSTNNTQNTQWTNKDGSQEGQLFSSGASDTQFAQFFAQNSEDGTMPTFRPR